MKSRLIKFACHNCGTKLAVPPEMAGVTDQCPKCGTTITAPPESTLEPVRRKAKFAPVPAASPEHESHVQPEMPVLPGWSASELADALKPSPPLPAYAPLAHAQTQPQAQLSAPELSLLPDPPAIPDPGPLFVPKRPAYGEGGVAVAPPPQPASAKNEHPVLGSILSALSVPKARTAPAPAAAEAPLPPGPLESPVSEQPPPSTEEEVSAAPAPADHATAVEPSAVALSGTPPPLPEAFPPSGATNAERQVEAATPPPSEELHEAATGAALAPSPPESRLTEQAASAPETPNHAPPAAASSQVSTTPIALVPESLPDPRAAHEAAMPGMGEMLASGQIAQDPGAPPDTRDHRPLLYVPFLPVAESPKKVRRSQKRNLYILGVILFLVIDALLIDAVLLHWFIKVEPGALSEDTASQDAGGAGPAAAESAATTEPTPTTATVANANAGKPPPDASSAPAGVQPESAEPPKPAAPPMAIPLPGQNIANVPTATPVPGIAAPTPPEPKVAETATPPPSAAPAPPGESTPSLSPTPSSPPPAPPSPGDQGTMKTPAPTVANASKDSAVPQTTASLPPASTSAAVNQGTTNSASSVAALMGPQPNAPMATVEGDPPWLKRISPIFPAIDGTPLLPSSPATPTPTATAASSSQPVGPPPPLPPAPATAGNPAMPSLATTTNAAALPSTTPPDAPPATPAPAPAPETSSAFVGKVPDEAASALDVLRKFLAAPTWQERAAYVQKPEAIKSSMEKHTAKYGDGPIAPGAIKFVDRHPGRDGGPPYCMFEIEGGDLKHEVLVLIEQPAEGQPKVDWATFVEFKDDLLLKFLETKGEPNQSFRVLLSRKHYFAKDVPDLSSKDSFQVQQPNDRFDGHVFLPKSSALSKKLATQLGWNQNMPVIVELAWRTNGKLHWVEIVRIVSYGWRG